MKKSTAFIATGLAGFSIFAAMAFNGSQQEANQNIPALVKKVVHPDVSVFEVHNADYQALVIGYGEAKPKFELDLPAEVSGKVISMADNFASGNIFKAGETLVNLDKTDYQRAIAASKYAVAEAELNLLEQQRKTDQAEAEWKSSGLKGEPDSPLVLRKPQLEVAKAKLEQSKQELRQAQRDLDQTVVKAPFDALIVKRSAQLGSYLQAGNTVASIVSIDKMEVEITLASHQWKNLPDFSIITEQRWPVELISVDSGQKWMGYVERIERHLDSDTRQRSIVITVDNPLTQDTPLYPGTFLKARIQGKQSANLWQVPATSISQNGDVWLVNQNNVLEKHPVTSLYQQGAFAYIEPFNHVEGRLENSQDLESSGKKTRIVVRPLNSYSQGLKVQPIVEG